MKTYQMWQEIEKTAEAEVERAGRIYAGRDTLGNPIPTPAFARLKIARKHLSRLEMMYGRPQQ